MSKTGRNDPCRCGSGKKYKKCCADNDQQLAVMQNKKNILDEVFADVDEDPWQERGDEQYPSISEADQRLVDEWWDVYREMDTLEEIQPHLDTFLQNHPHLAENLGLEHEVLFELGAEYRRIDLVEKYIRFLLDFRNRFPAAYVKSAAYYDADIIAWLISQKRPDEIRDYLNYFIENPVRFVDQLYALIDLLLATDNTHDVIHVIKQVAGQVVDSSETIYAEDIVHPLLIDRLSPYIKADLTEEDIHQFVNDLHNNIPYSIVEDDNIVEIWTRKVQAITRPFGPWGDVKKLKKEDQRRMYAEATKNFMRYLRETANVSWMCAQYYADLANDFMQIYLEEKNKLTHLFRFSKAEMDNLLFKMTRQFGFYVNCTKLMSLLNGLYYFAAYLHKCGDLNDEETESMQMHCQNIFDETYPLLKKADGEARCFVCFPLYGPVNLRANLP